MASIDENRRVWGDASAWPDDGEHWSDGWGSAAAQWHTWLRPRLARALDGRRPSSIVELGCGHGRWTRFLLEEGDELVGVDVSARCVDHCAIRFADRGGASFALTDGRSLPGVGVRSADLVFSFDSLVHADAEAMAGYVAELGRVLAPGGTALVHHANLGAYRWERLPWVRRSARVHRALARLGVVEPAVHWRDPTVTAREVATWAEATGLRCVHQELIRWDTRRCYSDAISTIVRADDPRVGPLHIDQTPDLEPDRARARAWSAERSSGELR